MTADWSFVFYVIMDFIQAPAPMIIIINNAERKLRMYQQLNNVSQFRVFTIGMSVSAVASS